MNGKVDNKMGIVTGKPVVGVSDNKDTFWVLEKYIKRFGNFYQIYKIRLLHYFVKMIVANKSVLKFSYVIINVL